jgi:transposase
MPMNADTLQEQVAELSVHRVDYRPIVRAYMQKLGLVGLINQLVPSEMEVEPGLIVAGMIQDTFSGRSPLYRLKSFFSTQDTELLLGQPVDTEAFSDHNVARVMDRIYKVGTSRVFSELSHHAAKLFQLDMSSGHWDSTSVNVWGDYDVYHSDNDDRIRIVHGHSKDKRPDLKQFMMDMLCVEHNIPILGDCQDGNSSDKTLNNKLLTRISHHLSRDGIDERAFTYVADSAMVNEPNLACFHDRPDAQPLYFVTRLPFSYDEANRVVSDAVEANTWQLLGELALTRSTKARPVASYRSFETEVTLYEHDYRAVVIHSSSHDKRRQKRIDRQLTDSQKVLMAERKKSKDNLFHCWADAEAELNRMRALRAPFHRINGKVEEVPIYAPGRPRKDGTRTLRKRRYRVCSEVVEDAEAAAKKRAEAGCFVLLSNRPKDGTDAQNSKELLQTYKAQNGIEQNYRFLKDPLIVNDLFLKKPERIEVLGMVLLMCVLIWNLMQRTMRKHLEKTGGVLQGWDGKLTDRPTSFMMTTKFQGIMVAAVGNIRAITPALNHVQIDYLRALDLPTRIFIDPRPP